MSEKRLVPRLRFPEFVGDGEWEEKRVGEICVSFSGGTPNTKDKSLYNGDIPFIRSAEIGNETTELHLTESGLEKSSAQMVDKGDVLVALYGANSGDVAISKIRGAINQAILCLRCGESNRFFYQYFLNIQNWMVKTYLQGGQGNLSGEIIKSIPVIFPSSAEQTRIANCLSSLDSLITAESRQLDALKEHKKGLLQQLFPQEGERVPRVRFPEFAGDGSWYFSSLSSLANITQGGTPKTEVEEYWGGPVAWLTPAEMGKNIDPHISLTKRTITEAGLRSCTSDLLPPYSVILSTGKCRSAPPVTA